MDVAVPQFATELLDVFLERFASGGQRGEEQDDKNQKATTRLTIAQKSGRTAPRG